MKKNVKKTVERVEQVVVLNGRFYCLYFDMICEKITMDYSIHYIEVIDENLSNEIKNRLSKN